MLHQVFVPIHRAGWPFVAAFFATAVILGFLWSPLFWIGLAVTAWCLYFFRDPPRVVPARNGLVLSPADGRIEFVGAALPPPELNLGDQPLTRVSVFLNVFDVHVNRVPVDGWVSVLHYEPGTFVNAALDKASEDNERQSIRIDTPGGVSFGLVQIAGLIARRIVCELEIDAQVRAGHRFGLIRFGSRVDLYLPAGLAPLVVVGQRAIAGETIIADLLSDEEPRHGEQV